MLQEQVVPISFSGGLETKIDPKQIDAGKLLQLQNGVFTNPKEIIKRNGYLSLNNSVDSFSMKPIVSGNSLGSLNNVLTLTDNNDLYAYLPDLSSWTFSGMKTNTRISTANLTGLVGHGVFPSEISALNGLKLTVFVDSTNNNSFDVVLSDSMTNTVVRTVSTTLSSSIQYIQTLIFNGVFLVAVFFGSTIEIFTVSPVARTVDPAVIINVTPSGSLINGIFSIIANSTNLYVMYVAASGTLTLAKYDTSFIQILTHSFPAITSLLSTDLLLDPVHNELVAAYSYNNNLAYYVFDFNFTQIATHSQTETGINFISIAANAAYTRLGMVEEIITTATPGNIFFIKSTIIEDYRTTPVTNLFQQNFAFNTRLYSKLKYINGSYYYIVNSYDPNQPASFIVKFNDDLSIDLGNISIVGKFALGTGLIGAVPVGLQQWNGQSIPYLNALHTTISSGIISGIYQAAEMTLTFDQKLTNVTLGNNINYVGGVTSIYDGKGIAEAGYNLFPVITPIGSSGTGFTFEYQAIYTWIDFEGNLHRSAPSIAIATTQSSDISPTNAITVTITGYGLGEQYKIPNVIIELYRTVSTGTTFYLVGTANNTPLGDVVIVDTTTSTALTGNQQLYTTGGELENIGPPTTDLMTSFKNRVILVNAENPLQWWFSKQIIQGFPAEYSDILTQNIDQKGGDITALSTMDDKLIFFKQSNLWYVIGDGPSPNGQNNNFTYPQIISSDTGCINQNSIVLSPHGLFFQSPKGIYLLGRDLSLNYIGSPVERYNSSNVTSAQMISGTNQIRFSLDSGIVLVYDYFMQQWSTFTNIAANDAIIYNGNYMYLTSAGIVNGETSGVYIDPLNSAISLSLTTGWLSFAGLQGFERIKQFLILGESESPTLLSVKLAYDFDSTIAQTDNIPITSASIPMQYRIFMARQKCQSIQITLSDSPTTPTEGLRLSALALNVASKKGPFKKSAALTYG